jgi:excisionase family DNA binding protein
MPETFLTVKEVARRLAVGRTTVYELIAKRELVAIRIGRARRIPESALDRWIAQQVQDQGGFPWQTADTSTPAGTKRAGRHS